MVVPAAPPVTGWSLPSNFAVHSSRWDFPSASTHSWTERMAPPTSVFTSWDDLGGGPGSYFDFARFSFHVPTNGGGASAITPNAQTHMHTPRASSRIFICASHMGFFDSDRFRWTGCDSRWGAGRMRAKD